MNGVELKLAIASRRECTRFLPRNAVDGNASDVQQRTVHLLTARKKKLAGLALYLTASCETLDGEINAFLQSLRFAVKPRDGTLFGLWLHVGCPFAAIRLKASTHLLSECHQRVLALTEAFHLSVERDDGFRKRFCLSAFLHDLPLQIGESTFLLCLLTLHIALELCEALVENTLFRFEKGKLFFEGCAQICFWRRYFRCRCRLARLFRL